MSSKSLTDLSKLCVHTITTKPWAIETAAEKFARAGVKGITVWRDALTDRNVKSTGELLRGNGLHIVSLCRGGFFPSKEKSLRTAAVVENKKALDEAAALGTNLLVLVCGAESGQPLEESRKQISEGINEILEHAKSLNVRLAIEPLHPMYADTRSAINTMRQANDLAEALNSDFVGVAIDVYHLWWDPDLQSEIVRCGKMKKIFAFHICDWNVPTTDLLLDRGLMGEGCINIRQIRGWVEQAGFDGFNEVEIFSNKFWAQNQDDYLQKIITAYKNHS